MSVPGTMKAITFLPMFPPFMFDNQDPSMHAESLSVQAKASHSFSKGHFKKNGGAVEALFLASKSRLGCRLVCPYSAQTCQTFHHQYEKAKFPHSSAEG